MGLQNTVRGWGCEGSSFDWLMLPDMAIYTVAIAGIWQASGFVMAMFLAGLRSIDDEILRAATVDGASSFTIYRRIVIPMLRPACLSAVIILAEGVSKPVAVLRFRDDGRGGMTGFIEGVQRSQTMLFPDRLEDWIGEDDVVRVVDLFVDELDLADLGFVRSTSARTGRPATIPLLC